MRVRLHAGDCVWWCDTYSEKSDVWSFGVYMWEVTHRQEPFKDNEVFEIAMGECCVTAGVLWVDMFVYASDHDARTHTGVVNGTLRLSIDADATRAFGIELTDIIASCWQVCVFLLVPLCTTLHSRAQAEADTRPHFDEIVARLASLSH
jgi:hypothetical protein